jgi:hypothetical protein
MLIMQQGGQQPGYSFHDWATPRNACVARELIDFTARVGNQLPAV